MEPVVLIVAWIAGTECLMAFERAFYTIIINGGDIFRSENTKTLR
jgi:hypothetical protein